MAFGQFSRRSSLWPHITSDAGKAGALANQSGSSGGFALFYFFPLDIQPPAPLQALSRWCWCAGGENTQCVLYSNLGQRVLYAFFTPFLKNVILRFFTYPRCAFFTPIRHSVFYRVLTQFFCAFFFLSQAAEGNGSSNKEISQVKNTPMPCLIGKFQPEHVPAPAINCQTENTHSDSEACFLLPVKTCEEERKHSTNGTFLGFFKLRRARPSERAHARTSRDRQSASLVVLYRE